MYANDDANGALWLHNTLGSECRVSLFYSARNLTMLYFNPKAPEVLDIGSRRQTTHADVYALGMVSQLDTYPSRIPTHSSLVDAFGVFTHLFLLAIHINTDTTTGDFHWPESLC